MDKKPQKKPAEKRPRKISRQYLENAALYYLQRYASSAENLRRVLKRKTDRSCKFHEMDAEEFYPVIDDLVARYIASGLLNDRAFAEAKTATLRRQGKSAQAIATKLQLKGLAKNDISAAIETIDEDNPDADFEAAMRLARKKKLGAFRKKPYTDPKEMQKEMAALGRAGFGYEIARRVLGAPVPDED